MGFDFFKDKKPGDVVAISLLVVLGGALAYAFYVKSVKKSSDLSTPKAKAVFLKKSPKEKLVPTETIQREVSGGVIVEEDQPADEPLKQATPKRRVFGTHAPKTTPAEDAENIEQSQEAEKPRDVSIQWNFQGQGTHTESETSGIEIGPDGQPQKQAPSVSTNSNVGVQGVEPTVLRPSEDTLAPSVTGKPIERPPTSSQGLQVPPSDTQSSGIAPHDEQMKKMSPSGSAMPLRPNPNVGVQGTTGSPSGSSIAPSGSQPPKTAGDINPTGDQSPTHQNAITTSPGSIQPMGSNSGAGVRATTGAPPDTVVSDEQEGMSREGASTVGDPSPAIVEGVGETPGQVTAQSNSGEGGGIGITREEFIRQCVGLENITREDLLQNELYSTCDMKASLLGL